MMRPEQARTGAEFLQLCEQRRRQLRGRVQSPTTMSGSGLPGLPEGWVWSSLSSVCERVSVGHVGPTTEFFSDAYDSVALIRSQDVRPGRLEAENCARITPNFHASLKKSQLRGGDILVVRVGANRGDSCVVPHGLGELNCANIIFARPLYSGRFFGFFTRSDFGQHLLLSATTGAAQGVINTQSVAALPVPVPPWSVQERVASILSAYDDLIENNTWRIAILEEMARRIYEEWFVRFRFPGHEGVRMVESELGPMPERWRLSRVGALFTTVLGGTPSRARLDFWEDGTVPWVNSGKVNELRILEPSEQITELALARSATKLMPAGTTVLAITGATLGQVSMLGREMCANQSVVGVLPPDARWKEFVFWSFKTHIGRIIQRASGGAQQHINKDIINDITLIIPPEDLLRSFNEVAGPMNDLVLSLTRKNLNLRQTRDLLLPKLISGELDVSALPEPEALAA
jgi:type I restriction enzyme S subunit